MSEVRLYFGVKNVGLGAANWNALITEMQAKGTRPNSSNPSWRNHWRPSLDGLEWVFEGVFESTKIDAPALVSWLATTFGVNEQDIGVSIPNYTQYGRDHTISYPVGTDRFRLGIFGFVQGNGFPLWSDSHTAVLQYILDNSVDWEPAEP